jgi:ribonuclease Y
MLITIIGQVLSGLALLILGTIAGFILSNVLGDRGLVKAKQQAEQLIEEAQKDADKQKKQTLLETKQEIHHLKQDFDKQIKEKKQEADALDNKLLQRERSLDNRSSNLDKREANLDQKEQNLERRKQSLDDKSNRLDQLIEEQNEKLLEIARFTMEQARDLIFKRVEDEMASEIAAYIKEEEEKAKCWHRRCNATPRTSPVNGRSASSRCPMIT